MKTMEGHEYLSKRFQQIMEIAYRQGRVTATDLEAQLPGNPTNSTVRTQLRVLQERGHLVKGIHDGRYAYFPARKKPDAARTAMELFLRTYVDGSVSEAFAVLLRAKEESLTPGDFERMQELLDQARQNRRN